MRVVGGRGNENVLRFDVAMEETMRMDMLETGENLEATAMSTHTQAVIAHHPKLTGYF